MSLQNPSKDFKWSQTVPSVTLISCPVCHQPITQIQREDTGEQWYFHGRTVASPSFVLDDRRRRMAQQATEKRLTLTGQVAQWCQQWHRWGDHRPLQALLLRLQGARVGGAQDGGR